MPSPLHFCPRGNTLRASIKSLCLSTAILSIVTVPALAQQFVADGVIVHVPPGTTIDTGNQNGFSGMGMFAVNGGQIFSTGNVKIVTGGFSAEGVRADGGLASLNSTVSLNSVDISTKGIAANGLNAFRGSTISIGGGRIHTEGAEGRGAWASFGGTLIINNTDISTLGRAAPGVRVDSNSSAIITGGSIETDGQLSHGLATINGSLRAQNLSIVTRGVSARGVYALGSSPTINLEGVSVLTSGSTSQGLYIENSEAIVRNSSFVAQGVGSDAILAGPGSGNKTLIDVTNSTFRSDQARGIRVGNGSFEGRFNGSRVSGALGLMNVANGASGLIDANANSYLEGDVTVGNGATGSVSLRGGSAWQGAVTNGTQIRLDATSVWQMTGSSDLDNLYNDGQINFDAANPYKTLTVDDLDTNGGSFVVNTKLNEGGAASETDKVLVNGDASGSGLVYIRNNGGTGALTGTGATDGIQIIEIGGASDAEFKLGSAAIVGIYDYQLRKADGQNWYLQSEGIDVVDPEIPEIPEIPETGTGHVVDLVPGYNIALAGAQEHVLTTLDAFHERVVELRSQEMEDGFHAWTRGIGKTGSYSPDIRGYNSGGFNLDTAGVQFGGDYSLGGVVLPGDRLTFGVFGEYAHSRFDVDGRTAHGSISSRGLGGYVTWQQNAPADRKPGTGAYVDAVIKHDWLDFGVKARSVTGFDLKHGYDGRATTASLETGFGIDFGNNVVLTPQAQLTWSKVAADSFTDSYGIVVRNQKTESLLGRLGLRLEKTWHLDDALPAKQKTFARSVTGFIDTNVRHEFMGKGGLVASDTHIGSDMGGTRFDIGTGVATKVSQNVNLFARAAVEFGGPSDMGGKITGGLNVTW